MNCHLKSTYLQPSALAPHKLKIESKFFSPCSLAISKHLLAKVPCVLRQNSVHVIMNKLRSIVDKFNIILLFFRVFWGFIILV